MKTTLNEPCLEWHGTLSHGYGVKRMGGKAVLLHRWVVAQIHGWNAIDGKVVMHLCDNPKCYRYSHLRIGTQRENLADMTAKGRHGMTNKTHCPQGHPYDEANTIIERMGRTRRCRTCHSQQVKEYKARKRASLIQNLSRTERQPNQGENDRQVRSKN